MVAIPQQGDPTLDAMKEAVKASFKSEKRNYLGASIIGHPCSRHIWYGYHGLKQPSFSAETLWNFEDGNHIEDVVAARLRLVPGVRLWTHDADGKQYRFNVLAGKFSGAPDGVIKGLLQAPQSLHIWENKCCAQKKYDLFTKAKVERGEKGALKEWDEGYFVQAQVLMHYFKIDRHYLTVALAGGRDIQSCRTEYQPEVAEKAIDKADKILSATTEPARISEKKDFYQCRWCPFADICHG